MVTSGWGWLLVLSPIVTIAAFWFVFGREARRTERSGSSIEHPRRRIG